MTLKLKNDFILRRIVDTWVAVPIGSNAPNTSSLLTLSDTAAFLWNLIVEGYDYETIISKTVAEYDIDESTAKDDIEKFIETLRSHDILDN